MCKIYSRNNSKKENSLRREILFLINNYKLYIYIFFLSVPANPFSSFHCQSNPADLHRSKTYHRSPTMGNGTRASQPSFKIYHPCPFLNYSPRVFGIRLSINSSLPSPSPVDDVASFYRTIHKLDQNEHRLPDPRRDLSVNLFYTISVSVAFPTNLTAPILSRN